MGACVVGAFGKTTDTTCVDCIPLSCDLAVIIVVPFVFAVTNPMEDTEAMEGTLLDHTTPVIVAFVGNTDADSCTGVVVDKIIDVLMLTTRMGARIEIGIVAVFPLFVVAVSVAEPFAIGVTIPEALTVAIDVLLLDHVIVCIVVFNGKIVAVS